MSNWKLPSEVLPADGDLVDWIAPGGQEVIGGKKGPGQLWFLPPDHGVYCYYEPVFWRESGES